MKFEGVLKQNIGREVKMFFETVNGSDSFSSAGTLEEVNDDYIKVRVFKNVVSYINRKAMILTVLEVIGGEKQG